MKPTTPRPDPAGWLGLAVAIVGAVTLARLVLLRFNQTDLFVDESQYWLWGQTFAFGYYSKPPLVGWLIGGVTALAGSDTPFWIRAPFSVLHGATALILGALAAHLLGRRAAILVAASYVTLPMATVGSLLASTDTVMAPFFAAALCFHAHLLRTPKMRWALLAGAAAGVAFLAKYAAVYFLLGVFLGAVLFPAMRIAVRHAAGLGAAFLLVIAPNIVWNAQNGFATMSHTVDNVGWVRDGGSGPSLDPLGALEFVLSQFAVAGPLVFVALVLGVARPATSEVRRLAVFALPALALVTLQALLDRAYANWAASAYFAGTLLAVAVLAERPRWMAASLVINGTIALLLPLLTTMPTLSFGNDRPLLARYLGQDELSHQILAASKARCGIPIVADRRDVLADLFLTGRDQPVAIYARPPRGRPMNHYEQAHALPSGAVGPVLYVTARPPVCPASPPSPAIPFDREGGAYDRIPLAGYVIDAECLDAGS